MPDKIDAQCYARTIAEGFPVKQHYPNGFEHHYFFPQRLREPLGQKNPSKIFMDAMGDFCGGWVPTEQALQVLRVVEKASQHTFQILTKAPHRVHLFNWPENVWVGVSAPPDMMGKAGKQSELSLKVKEQYWETTATNLATVKSRGNKVWASLEPVSSDLEVIMEKYGLFKILDWVVIGAASRGHQVAQPKPEWITKLLARCDIHDIPVFMKGNLGANTAVVADWHTAFPSSRTVLAPEQASLPF
jgi:protein gp37